VPPTRVLILCTGNSCRSQMAEAFLKAFDPSLEVCSAGTAPAPLVHPYAVVVMEEAGIDISDREPKPVEEFLQESFDWVITVCGDAAETCPAFHGKVGRRIHIGFEDPAAARGTSEQVLTVFRRIRDEIQKRFREFYERHLKQERRGTAGR